MPLDSEGKGFLAGNGFDLYPEALIILETANPHGVGNPLWND